MRRSAGMRARSRAVRRKDPSPPWQWPFVLAFTGVRGIVSLAAALAIPFTIADGSAFPDRDLILFLTSCALSAPRVGEGLPLPPVPGRLVLLMRGVARDRPSGTRSTRL